MPTLVSNPFQNPVPLLPYGRMVPPNSGVIVAEDPDVVDAALGAGHGLKLTQTISANQPANDIISRDLRITDPTYFIDPTSGSDAALGTQARPLKSTTEALRRLFAFGWKGKPRIHYLGIDNLGTNPKILLPDVGVSGACEPIMFTGTSARADAGDGTLTVTGSTAGSGQTFGTVTVGGTPWSSNNRQGCILRFTSGARAGFEYFVATNTNNTLTLAGSISTPTNGDTFVLERPAAGWRWTGRLTIVGSGSVFGLKHFLMNSVDNTGFVSLYGCTMQIHCVHLTGLGTSGFQVFGGSNIENIGTATTMFSDNTILVSNALFASPLGANGSFFINPGCRIGITRSVHLSSPVDSQTGGMFQVQNAYFTGLGVRMFTGVASVLSCRFDTCAGSGSFTGGAQGAAITVAKSAWALIIGVDISGTTAGGGAGDGVFVEGGSRAEMQSVTGTGNAGVGCRLGWRSDVKNISGNTVTGANDVQVGGNSATTWAGGNNTDDLAQAAGTRQGCFLHA